MYRTDMTPGQNFAQNFVPYLSAFEKLEVRIGIHSLRNVIF
jgi:hypothetical protein